MKLKKCKLCGEMRELQESHAIGNAIFKKLFQKGNGSAKSYTLNDTEIRNSSDSWATPQLCFECEQYINNEYENYAIQVIRARDKNLKFSKHLSGLSFQNIDSEKLFKYVLSVIWRGTCSNHSSYKKLISSEGMREYLKGIVKGESEIKQTIFNVRICRLSDHRQNGFSNEILKGIIISPYSKLGKKEPTFTLNMIYEGFLFQLHVGDIGFKQRQKSGFIQLKRDFLFVPYVNIFDIPELMLGLIETHKIGNKVNV